jgi:Asp-tRNA(Asn)/Glu-tRNA(Gln) amidotransferase A subunit family amidase
MQLSDSVSDLDATATAALVRTGQVSPRELVDGAIARIERHNAELGAEAWAWIRGASRRAAAFWTTHDLWLTPTVTEPPPPLGTFHSPPDDPLADRRARTGRS